MDQLAIDSVVVDRCSTCSGLWFDAGEAEKLRDKRVAASLDIGDPVSGEAHNAIDRYRCPRCGGHMIRMVDPKQTHIWYEKCGSCHGSYFDAGEFLDLATFSPSDFFKRFSAQERT
jgi:Zn-finger nucleic acid-binding protein